VIYTRGAELLTLLVWENRIAFDDLHNTGIYTWNFLHSLGELKFHRMRQYLQALKDQGLSRDPPRKKWMFLYGDNIISGYVFLLHASNQWLSRSFTFHVGFIRIRCWNDWFSACDDCILGCEEESLIYAKRLSACVSTLTLNPWKWRSWIHWMMCSWTCLPSPSENTCWLVFVLL
jgi:hypothetical protein